MIHRLMRISTASLIRLEVCSLEIIVFSPSWDFRVYRFSFASFGRVIRRLRFYFKREREQDCESKHSVI